MFEQHEDSYTADDEVKQNFILGEKNTNVAMQRILGLLNQAYNVGFYQMGMKPEIGIGFTGDAAVVFEKYNHGEPLIPYERQRELVKSLVELDDDVFYFNETHETYSGLDRPIFLIMERDTNEKIMGLEIDKIVIYQPHEPNVMNYMSQIAKAIKSEGKTGNKDPRPSISW